MLTECQQELQEQFIQYGYDLQFVDINFNVNYDSCKDPYLFASLLKEIEDCSSVSDAVFFLVSFFFYETKMLLELVLLLMKIIGPNW